jgi:hypothetical protein
MSLILQNTAGKSHLVHLVDTPGHVNFVDEVACAMRLVDGVVLVVDVVEGVSRSIVYRTVASNTLLGNGGHGGDHPTCFARTGQDDFGRKQARSAYS